jgi:preprotein translocase subunit YajC
MNNLLDFFPVLLGVPQGGSGAPAGGGGSLVTTVVTFGLVILIFYFLIIRPQSKKQKDTKRMIADLKKGDKIVTIGGIRGTVTRVSDDTIVVKVADSTKLEMSKSAVSSVLEQNPGKKETTKSDSADKKNVEENSDEDSESQES